jgi:hypothetical protein
MSAVAAAATMSAVAPATVAEPASSARAMPAVGRPVTLSEGSGRERKAQYGNHDSVHLNYLPV